MKKVMKAMAALMLMTAAVCAGGCDKPENNVDPEPINEEVKVTTYTPQDITQTTAKCGGDVVTTQGLSMSELGVCWSKGLNPTMEDAHLSTTNWSEPYVCTLTGLEPGTQYHVRAYALRGLECYYGEDKSFITEGNNGGGGGLNVHEWVDLGLPSRTLWATCNVGANSPEEYGDYFAWGETEPKEDLYNWRSYKYANGGDDQLTKYCSDPDYGYNGFTDYLTILQSVDDAATANCGNGWCMPTKEQWLELYHYVPSTWTTQNRVYGQLFTAHNGQSLFLPAAGGRVGGILGGAGSYGDYWSSSLCADNPHSAWGVDFSSNGYGVNYDHGRCFGYSVRAVREN